MAVSLLANGKADWTNYQDYWRDQDAEWLQERTILRYASDATRSAAGQYPSPTAGTVTYNAATDQLEHYTTSTPAKWIGVLASQHLRVTPKVSANDTDPVVLGHRSAGGAGIQFFQTVSSENKIALNNAYLDIGGGEIVAKPTTGLTVTTPTSLATTKIKTGTKTVTLTTDATQLLIDTKINAPSADIDAITMSGTLSGGASSVVNANSGTIGGVTLSGNYAYATGFIGGQGYFYGSGASAVMRHRETDGTTYGVYVQVTATDVLLIGGYSTVKNQLRLYNNNSVQFYSADPGSLLGQSGPVVYTSTSLTAANYPEGTIWVKP